MTERKDGQLGCHECHAYFPYRLIHDGFNESAHAYCERCGRTLIVQIPWQDPTYSRSQGFGPITPAVEASLSPCSCGGQFKASAAPRCPACHAVLSAVLLRPQIETNAPGTSSGWRWQESWQGIYAIIVDEQRTICLLPAGA
jgi:hypothetical protein